MELWFYLGCGCLGWSADSLGMSTPETRKGLLFYFAVGLWGVVALESDLANTENLVKIEASDWSRTWNAGFSLLERSLRILLMGYPYDLDIWRCPPWSSWRRCACWSMVSLLGWGGLTTVREHPPQSLTFISDKPTNRYWILIVDIIWSFLKISLPISISI